MIHTTAIVPASAKLGQNVEIGAYAVLEDGVEIGDNSLIEAHAHIKRGARIGRGCSVGSFATVSGDPQDLHFDRATVSFVEIGDGTAVREGATVHRAPAAGGSTRVGKNCLLMANSHIGHDCVVGDRCILAPFCALGGFVRMGNDAFVSGGDIPPYVNAHKRNTVAGINLIGMRRRTTPAAAVAEVKRLYMAVYSGGVCADNAGKLLAQKAYSTPEGENFLRFFAEPGRHYIHVDREKRR